MNRFIRSHPRFKKESEKAKAILRAARAVASDETGVRIEGTNPYPWVFHCKDAVVHQPDYFRAARVVDEIMDGAAPAAWISDLYWAQQSRGERHRTCLAHWRATRLSRLNMVLTICPCGSSFGWAGRSIWPHRGYRPPTPGVTLPNLPPFSREARGRHVTA